MPRSKTDIRMKCSSASCRLFLIRPRPHFFKDPEEIGVQNPKLIDITSVLLFKIIYLYITMFLKAGALGENPLPPTGPLGFVVFRCVLFYLFRVPSCLSMHCSVVGYIFAHFGLAPGPPQGENVVKPL